MPMSTPSALKNPKRTEYDDITSQLEALSSKVTEIVIQWIPAHCGIPGNERADQLAKQGAQKDQPNPGTSYEEIKTILQREGQKEWKTLHPESQNTEAFDMLNRDGQVIIFRLRTGHCRLKGHLYQKLKVGDNGLCPCDSGEIMTPAHILQDCQMFGRQRQETWPDDTSLEKKLYGCLGDLNRTTQFVRKCGLDI